MSLVCLCEANEQVDLAKHMEDMFQATLAQNRNVQYDNFVWEVVPE
jgi:hypothetical protein